MRRYLSYLTILLLTASCTGTPKGAVPGADPVIYPDYTNITVPAITAVLICVKIQFRRKMCRHVQAF